MEKEKDMLRTESEGGPDVPGGYPPFAGDRLAEDKEFFEVYEKFHFDGNAIFSDIDGTLTDNTGEFDRRALDAIHEYQKTGGIFVPVTGRARFESVRDVMRKTGSKYAVINNGAEIFDRDGHRIFESVIPDEQVRETFDIAREFNLTWMQNKKNPATGEEFLYSNFTPETEQAMLDVGIVDTVHNEEGRIGLTAKQATPEEVMAIPGQNYKIQMMSPDPGAVRQAYGKLCSKGIPCMLNMQSKKTGEYHWVEVIKGTKIDGIQWLIDSGLIGEIRTAEVVGDGGNDLTMFKELHDREGNPIENIKNAVGDASRVVKEAADRILKSRYDDAERDMGKGGAIVEVIEETLKARMILAFLRMSQLLLEKDTLDEEELDQWITDFKAKYIKKNQPAA